MTLDPLIQDLLDEQAALDAIATKLAPSRWNEPTASPGWSVGDQIGHLTYFDEAASTAIENPEAFAVLVASLRAAMSDGTPDGSDRLTVGDLRRLDASERLERWRRGRDRLEASARTLEDGDRVAWYGPPMSAKSFITARLMECWAHGQHVADAVGATIQPTTRLRHIARLGHLTLGWSFANRGLDVPAAQVEVRLAAPDGDTWSFGSSATDHVVGSALDFCQVVTQVRHLDDTDLAVSGPVAAAWMDVAQAFAGPPTDGPAAGGGTPR